jgi:hypothetical protein
MLLRRRLDRPWTMPILGGVRLGPLTPGLLEYVEALSLLFAAIQRVSRASILVDSSKAASYALLLRSIVGPDLRVVHLVRDSRGVVYSWRKRVPRGDGAQRADDHMIQYRVSGAALRYLFYNGAAQSLATAGLPYLRIRYEEMVKDPRACLDRVLRLAGLERHDGDLQFLEPAGVLLAPNHTVDGNAVRFTRGRVPLVLDDDWRTSMRPVERAAVTVLTTPLLIRYGYLRDESGEYPARHAALPTPPSKATG